MSSHQGAQVGIPGVVEQVKLRLRAEQVARERAAGDRCRDIEDEEARDRQARTQVKGKNSWAEGRVFFVSLGFVLSFVVPICTYPFKRCVCFFKKLE